MVTQSHTRVSLIPEWPLTSLGYFERNWRNTSLTIVFVQILSRKNTHFFTMGVEPPKPPSRYATELRQQTRYLFVTADITHQITDSHCQLWNTPAITTPSCLLRQALYDMVANGKVENLGRHFGQLGLDLTNSSCPSGKWLCFAEYVIAARPHSSSVQMTAIYTYM